MVPKCCTVPAHPLSCKHCYISSEEWNTEDKYEFPVTSPGHYASLLRMIVLLKLSMKPVWQPREKVHEESRAALANGSKGRAQWFGGVICEAGWEKEMYTYSFRVWSHRREIRGSHEQIPSSLHPEFNFENFHPDFHTATGHISNSGTCGSAVILSFSCQTHLVVTELTGTGSYTFSLFLSWIWIWRFVWTFWILFVCFFFYFIFYTLCQEH